jgi:hypothetical protein
MSEIESGVGDAEAAAAGDEPELLAGARKTRGGGALDTALTSFG